MDEIEAEGVRDERVYADVHQQRKLTCVELPGRLIQDEHYARKWEL